MLLNLVPPLYIFFHIHNTLKIQLYDGVPNVNVYVCMKTGYFWVLQQTIDIFFEFADCNFNAKEQ